MYVLKRCISTGQEIWLYFSTHFGYIAFKKGRMDAWKYGQGLVGEIRPIERQFDIH